VEPLGCGRCHKYLLVNKHSSLLGRSINDSNKSFKALAQKIHLEMGGLDGRMGPLLTKPIGKSAVSYQSSHEI